MKTDFPLSPKARKSGTGWIDICPAHDDRLPSLSISCGADGKLLLHCFAGCSFEEIISAAGLSSSSACRSATSADLDEIKRQQQQEEVRKLDYCRTLWKQGQPIEGTLSQAYLASRGIDQWSVSQRHHPSLMHAQYGEAMPALLTVVQRSGHLVGLHRTYLNADATKRDKLMLGKCKGGAAHLIGQTGPLIVAEGIETALSLPSLHKSDNGRYWSALSASGMKSLELPANPDQLILAADGDTAGLSAAQDLGERAARRGWEVILMQAPEGNDWNDILMEQQNA
jgi:hypothetical protein